MKPALAIACLLLYAAEVHGDTKISNQLKIAGQNIDSVLYIKGNRVRSEMHLPDATMVRVDRCGSTSVLHINDQNRAYFYEHTSQSLLPGEAPESSVVTVMSKTTDTGEHKQILGREAHHLKTEISIGSASGSCGNEHMVADGWYVALDFMPSCLSPDIENILRDRMRGLGCHARLRFQSSGALLTGYPMVLDMTLQPSSSSGSGKGATSKEAPISIHQETLDISTIPADEELFRPPEGYREVRSMEELLSASGSGATADDEDQLTEQRSHANNKPKPAGAIRIGVAYPQFEVDAKDKNAKKFSPESIRKQIAAELQAQGFDSVQLDSEIKEDALKECQPLQCDYIILAEVSAGHGTGSGNTQASTLARGKGGVNYEAHITFTVSPLANPARHLEGENFYDSTNEKVSLTAVIQQAAKTVKEQIATLK